MSKKIFDDGTTLPEKFLLTKEFTKSKFANSDGPWEDKIGYTDYLNEVDKGDKQEQKGKIFLDSAVEYQKFLDTVLPRLPTQTMADGANPFNAVLEKMNIIKDTDAEFNKFILKIIDIYGDDNRRSRKYLINLKFEIYKLQINGMRVLIKKYVDDSEDLQGTLDDLLDKVMQKVRLMNDILEMTGAKKVDGGLNRPEVADKMNQLIKMPSIKTRDKN